MLRFWLSPGAPWPRGLFYGLLLCMLAVLGCLHILPVWLGGVRGCFHYYDLGIYSQAIAQLGLHNVNPWLCGRQVRIFNDHVDPILWTTQLWPRRIGVTSVAILTESVYTVLVAWPFVWLRRRGDLTDGATLLLCGLSWFNSSLLHALHYPVHPGTWSILPLTWMMIGWLCDCDLIMVAGLAVACACKEDIPPVGMALALILAVQRRWRGAAWAACVSGGWLFFTFALRPWLMGPSVPYASTFVHDLLTHPCATLARHARVPKLASRLGECLLIIVPSCVARGHRYPWKALGLLLPLLGMRFLGERWAFHYMAPLGAILASSLVAVWWRQPLPRWVALAYCMILTSWQSAHVREAVALLTGAETGTRWQRCPVDPPRQAALRTAEAWVTAQPGRLLASSNVVFGALLLRPQTYVVHGATDSAAAFDLVFYDKIPHGGGFYPDIREADEIAAQLLTWRQEATDVLYDDARFFVARGAFSHPMHPARIAR